MTDRPLIGVALIIRKEGKVLIGRRIGKHAHGFWGFPGGHLEKWEAFEECAIREMREEAGEISVTRPKFWTAANTRFYSEGRHYVVLFMVCDHISGDPQLMEPDKCEGWEWRTWDDLPTPLMMGIQYLVANGFDPFEM